MVIADTANSMTVIGDLTRSEDPIDSGTASGVTLAAVYPLPGDIEIPAPGFNPGPDPAATDETEQQEATQPEPPPEPGPDQQSFGALNSAIRSSTFCWTESSSPAPEHLA